MSAVAITIQALKAAATVTAVTTTARIYPMVAPQGATYPNIVVHLISENDTQMVDGPALWAESRVSVECRANSASSALDLGQVVVTAIGGTTNASLAGKTATIWQSGSDYSDYSDDRTVFRRIVDFTLRWR
jgi:hypothetical protein